MRRKSKKIWIGGIPVGGGAPVSIQSMTNTKTEDVEATVAQDVYKRQIKRNTEIKDYGKLIPGHGGILDRFDSVIITAPIIFALMQAFG